MADDKKILISIEINDKNASAKLDKTSKSTDKLAAATKKLTYLQSEEARQLAVTNQQIKIQTEINDALAKSELGLATSKAATIAQQKQFKTNAGLNNAIIAESARLASDASYGFTAIANNLGQLVSLFSASANAAGGLKSAIAALFTAQSLFLIGIQLLITYGADIVNFFKGGSKAAEEFKKSLEDLEETIQSQRRELLGYIDVLRQSNISEKVRLNALKELEAASPGIVDSYKDQKTSLEDLTKQVEHYIKQQRLRGELDAILEANQELFAKRERIRNIQRQLDAAQEAGDIQKMKELYMDNASFFEKYLDISDEAYEAAGGVGLAGRLFGADEDINFAELFRVQTEDTIGEYDDAVKRIVEIEKQLEAEPDEPRGGRGSRARVARFGEFKEALFRLDKEIAKIEQDSLDRFLTSEQSKLQKEEFNQKELFKIRFNTFKENQTLRQQEFEEAQAKRLQDFLARKEQSKKTKQELAEDVRARKSFDEAIANSRKELNKSIESGEIELNEVLEALTENYNNRRIILEKETAQRILAIAYDTQLKQAELLDEQIQIPKIFQEEAIKTRMNQARFEIELQRGIVESYKEGTIERAEAAKKLAELEIGLARDTFAYEKQRFAQIEEIYSQGADSIGFISEAIKNNEIKNAGESEEAIEKARKKAWKVDKALKISGVIMDTYKNGFLAYGSQLFPGDPTSLGRAHIAQALTLAKGAAQIAAIASTQYNSSSMKGGGRGARTEVEAPDFNVVGASPESQLAQSVAQQQTQPLRAFVVGKDITSQQELDRNILTNAGLGD